MTTLAHTAEVRTCHPQRGSGKARHVRHTVNGGLRWAGEPPIRETRRLAGQEFCHDFSRVAVHERVPAAAAGVPGSGRTTDRLEGEADRVADVMVAPLAHLAPVDRGVGPGGIPKALQRHFELGLGESSRTARIHFDAEAVQLANAFRARALTFGSNIYFGANGYAPWTPGGQRLLAHELVHVAQQQSVHAVQRQEIPTELRSSADVDQLDDPALHQRYDLITATMSRFDHTTVETALLEEEAGRIGAELAKRTLATGRTFARSEIDAMSTYFIRNAKRPKPRNCIDTMNDGLRLLFGEKTLPVGDSVDRTMARLSVANRAGAPYEIEFEDQRGRASKSGALFPYKVRESVWDAVLSLAGGDFGWSVFGMGPADMSHSVTLTLDNNDPAHPVVYWSDQWPSKGGWKRYDRAGLDAEVANVTQIIWNKKDAKHKPDTKLTLWRLAKDPTVMQPAVP